MNCDRATLFIDESGQATLIDVDNKPLLLTGVILKEKDVVIVESFFNYIKAKYGIDPSKPFHSYHIFENDSSKLSDRKAKELSQAMADFINIIPIELMIFSVDKAAFKKTLGIESDEQFKGEKKRKEMKEFPHRIMSAKLFEWFARYLERNDSIGQIIVDARRGGDAQLIKTLYACKESEGPFEKEVRDLIKDRCTAICFAEKNYLSGGLEIADLISYVSFQHAQRLISSLEVIGLNHLWKSIKEKLPSKSLIRVSEEDIRKFFKIEKDGVHKYLKK